MPAMRPVLVIDLGKTTSRKLPFMPIDFHVIA
jgi:hypothetical protein